MLLRLKPLIICIFLAIYALPVKAIETVLISKKLQWNDQNTGNSPSGITSDFEFSLRKDDSGNLPLFVHTEELKEYSTISSITWINSSSESFDQQLFNPDDQTLIGSDWKIEARITEGGRTPYLIFSLLPLRKTDHSGFERLLSFEIEVQINPTPKPNLRSLTFAEHSQLATGTWYKIATAKDGVYKIDKNLLTQLGVNTTTLNPQNINIYGNGGELLPEQNDQPRPDDLQKCAITIEGESDGVFNDVDFILFYAKGPDSWDLAYDTAEGRSRWVHDKHYYSDSAYYFIRIDDTDPLRIQNAPLATEAANHTCTTFQDYIYYENDIYNLGQSGREFFGDEFYLNSSASYNLTIPNMVSSQPAMFETRVAVRSLDGPSNFTIEAGGTSVDTSPVTSSEAALANVASVSTVKFSVTPSGNFLTANFLFNKYSNTSGVRGYIDYIRLNATRSLQMSGSQMKFRDTLSTGPGMITSYELGAATNGMRIWDITDFMHPQVIGYQTSGSAATWKIDNSSLHEYIGFNNSGFLTPTSIGAVVNQDLHALNDVDLVIIAAPLFKDVANSIAEIHAAEGHTVVVTGLNEIFNEFSSGTPDVIAVRMLMKMLYDRAAGDINIMPQNLLLIGDGDYQKNKGTASFLNENMMVFESSESLSPAFTYVSDDYFVFLGDDDDGSNLNMLDAGVGRIPATDLVEAQGYVDKILAYISQNTQQVTTNICVDDQVQSAFGSWRNLLTFIADDQDGSGDPTEQIHLEDADSLSNIMRRRHPEYDIVKIYMDAYKQESTPGGERYPDGELAIKNRVQNGSLIVSYLGHGGGRGWAHERILDLNSINSWSNKYRLPVFLTATCELARYDDPSFNSAGEQIVMNPDGGAIAMLTTTRIVFAGSNMQLDLAFFDVALEEESISNLNLGKINMLTKNGVALGNSSKPNFSLLGDPMLKMTYPLFNVVTTSINNIDIDNFNDTLKALQEVEIKGFVASSSGNKMTDFNGIIFPTVYDKMTHVYTQNNDFNGEDGDVQEYDVFNKNIFKGKASVVNGDFSFRFVVPFDISYTVDTGRVSYYAVSGNIDAHGYCEEFVIGSSLEGAQLNTIGPEIELFMNDTTFVSGGVTDTEPVFVAVLRDENGINTVGNGIGHDLIAVLDSDSQNPIVLNEYYETDLDTYQSGRINYKMPELDEGNHTISLKAWDIHNNSSNSSLDFVVAASSEIALEHVLNYPNPFTTHTEFMFEHNQACVALDVRLQVFTVSGKLVKTIEQKVMQNGFRSDPIAWDGTDDFGDRIGRGVYVYKLEVRNDSGETAEQFEKLVILR
ncbi:MAG: type IX secretion system sortase PorU [Flavobacteriales bacterium]|nr:type IX secretion system sortase PorU [Flavobacteriales bacterium]